MSVHPPRLVTSDLTGRVYVVTRANTVATWDNRSAPAGATNTLRRLTHQLESGERQAAMKATHCNVDGCGRKHHSRGMCNIHYKRLRRRQGSFPPIPPGPQLCSVDDCDNGGRLTRGLCEAHYLRWRHHGTTDLLPRPSAADRLAAGLVRALNGCLEWTGNHLPKGYGTIWFDGRQTYTHRVAWELVNGPIPEGLFVLHHCDNPPCCETAPSAAYPEGHLFLGTHDDNMADMVAKGRARGRLSASRVIDNREQP